MVRMKGRLERLVSVATVAHDLPLQEKVDDCSCRCLSSLWAGRMVGLVAKRGEVSSRFHTWDYQGAIAPVLMEQRKLFSGGIPGNFVQKFMACA